MKQPTSIRKKGYITLDRAIIKLFAQHGLRVMNYKYEPLVLTGRWTIEATAEAVEEKQ